MDIQILKELLEDFDCYGFIKAGSYADTYDNVAVSIFPKLSKDLSIVQLEAIIWDAFYEHCCVCTVGVSKEPFIIDKSQAMFILGSPERFKTLAYSIRQDIIGI